MTPNFNWPLFYIFIRDVASQHVQIKICSQAEPDPGILAMASLYPKPIIKLNT